MLLLWLGGAVAGQARAATPAESLRLWLAELERSTPRQAAEFAKPSNARLDKAAEAVELWCLQLTQSPPATNQALLESVGQLLSAKNQVDRLLDDTLDVRRRFVESPADQTRHDALCAYLQAVSRLTDLSGRLRYLQVDALGAATPRLVSRPADAGRLLERLMLERSSVGAFLAAQLCWATPTGGRAPTVEPALQQKVLQLVAATGETSVLPLLVTVLEQAARDPALAISAAETIRRIGLPQEPWPDPIETLPDPPVTPRKLRAALSRIAASRLRGDLARRHAELTRWLDLLVREGVSETSYRIGSFDVQPGDWLLMRNPSPYNQFTDLTPGLFTHVGVVTLARGSDGVQRMVLVDLPERGRRIPAANVETYVLRSLNYCFLRHADPATAAAMGQAAHDVIGNESLFDLNFRLDGVLGLRNQPLVGKKIETYCAGLLLLCALQTTSPREEFFPIPEHPAGGKTLENLAKLGLSMDDDFISPTGAMFSTKLRLVGRREPMYDPRREVEEAVFDHFAHLLATQTLVPSPDLFQSLRLKLAEASRGNALLAEALARAARVNTQTDLVSAAKAAAVVETLDEIAFGASRQFLDARESLLDEPADALARQGVAAGEVATVERFQRRHAALYQARRQGKLTPRRLRVELVKFYSDTGKRELERRFFAP
ncbi:MAG TPA: hypothetical protein VJ783_16950 [Pirellulales bacterium]|nr:hypothetical protein [Pirellulales bacterium]